MAELTQLRDEVKSLSTSDRKQLATEALKDLSASDQKDVVDDAGVGKPDQNTTNTIWVIVVAAFVVVFIGSFAALAYLYLTNAPTIDKAVDKLLLVFTTVSAFLAGLLAPSPVRNNPTE
jgi:hypothetical protein